MKITNVEKNKVFIHKLAANLLKGLDFLKDEGYSERYLQYYHVFLAIKEGRNYFVINNFYDFFLVKNCQRTREVYIIPLNISEEQVKDIIRSSIENLIFKRFYSSNNSSYSNFVARVIINLRDELGLGVNLKEYIKRTYISYSTFNNINPKPCKEDEIYSQELFIGNERKIVSITKRGKNYFAKVEGTEISINDYNFSFLNHNFDFIINKNYQFTLNQKNAYLVDDTIYYYNNNKLNFKSGIFANWEIVNIDGLFHLRKKDLTKSYILTESNYLILPSIKNEDKKQ